MRLKLQTAPAVEPVTLQEAKNFLRVNSETFADDVSSSQSIAPGDHIVAAAYSLRGAGVDVSAAAHVLVILAAGACGVGGTVDVKLQESNTDVEGDYTDVTGGAFAQVTEANDQASYELAYSGTKKYIRAVATVGVATCDFGLSIILDSPAGADDDLISDLITAARQDCENFLNRALCTQTWDLYLEAFPGEDEIRIPLPPLQSVTHVKYKDTSGVLQTWDEANYIVDTMSDRVSGRIALAYMISWPNTYSEIQAVQIRFVAGYGVAEDVPKRIKTAILRRLADLYDNRGDKEIGDLDSLVQNLLWHERVVPL